MLVSDKLQHFLKILGVQRLDVPQLRGRTETVTSTAKVAGEKKNEKKGAESTKEVDTSDRVGTSGNDVKVKKDRAN